MSYKISGTTITMTRGDTFKALLSLVNSDGSSYIPDDGDTIRFAMKSSYEDELPLLVKEIPSSTMVLKIDSADTKPLPFGNYVYDIQLTKPNNEVDTVIERARLKITEEVD